MKLLVNAYLGVLAVFALGWLFLQRNDATASWLENDLLLAGAVALYASAHGVRMLRLGLLTLDWRDKAVPLICAHALTAFPSALLPFKLGEMLRLAAFCHIFEQRRKAFAVWLSERFADMIVIASGILTLKLLDVPLPDSMRWVLLLFVLASVFGLLGLFGIATTFVYLNRHLVLTSHSQRGLLLLKVSHALRDLELAILRSLEGRMSGLLLLSILIWTLEVAAFALFTQRLTTAAPDLGAMFASGLLASLPGGAASSAGFTVYQCQALLILTLVFLATLLVARRLRGARL